MKKILTLLIAVSALLIQPVVAQSVSSGVFLGWDWNLLDMSTTSPALTSPTKAFFGGSDWNGPNQDLHSSLNNNFFTIDLGSLGSASFRLNRNSESDGGWMRHYEEGTNAIAGLGDYVRIELTDLTPGTILTLNYVAFNSLDDDADFLAVLPNGNSASGSDYATLNTPWSAGETLRLVAPAVLANNGYNLAGWQMTATPVPEPATMALFFGLAGLAFVVVRRRMKA